MRDTPVYKKAGGIHLRTYAKGMVGTMNDSVLIRDSIANYAAHKANTVRFTCGSPKAMRVFADGSRMLFLRSSGDQDTVASLWMATIDRYGDNKPAETLVADPRTLIDGNEEVPPEERARRERAREAGTGIVDYSADVEGRVVAFTVNGALFVTEVDVAGGPSQTRRIVPNFIHAEDEQFASPVLNPRMSADGTRVAYSTGSALVVVNLNDNSAAAVMTVPAERRDVVKVGLAEFAAGEEMDRYEGFWWGPDSRTLLVEEFDSTEEPLWYISDPVHPDRNAMPHRYPRALTHNAIVSLTAVRLEEDGPQREALAPVEWDREAFEYLAVVRWEFGHLPVMQVQNRAQTDDRILEIVMPDAKQWDKHEDHKPLHTRELDRHHNDQWLDLVQGTPCYAGKWIVCAENDMLNDTNRLTINGIAFTPAGWQVRKVLDANEHNVLCVVQRTPELAPDVPQEWESTKQYHDARSYDVVTIDYDGNITPVTTEPGVWTAARAGDGIVVSGRTMSTPRTVTEFSCAGQSLLVRNLAAEPGFTPNVRFTTLGEDHMFAAIITPMAPEGGEINENDAPKKIPVIMQPYGGPGFQRVTMSVNEYWDAQWWAEQGYMVVICDGHGTTGRGPKWDRAIWHTMKQVTLDDQVHAVQALNGAINELNAAKEADEAVLPQADTDHVGIMGWSYGGFLSALAVLDAPDTFAAACAGAPPTDWTLYDTHYTERYLGLEERTYEDNSIIKDAPRLSRPLMLIHGFADDNVTIAHSLRLSEALLAAGKEHTFLPLNGITHMTNDPVVAHNLLLLQLDFLDKALKH